MLLILGSILNLNAQSRLVKGQVTDAKGETLPSVSVVLKGSQSGTITDLDGKYSLQVADAATAQLVFSFIGYETLTTPVNGQTELNVSLTADEKVLDEVVVMGYESVNRRDVTGAVSSVSDKQLKDIPLSSAAEALAGRLAL